MIDTGHLCPRSLAIEITIYGWSTGGGTVSRPWLVDPLCGTLNFASRLLHTGRGLIVAADPEVHRQLVAIVEPHLAALAG